MNQLNTAFQVGIPPSFTGNCLFGCAGERSDIWDDFGSLEPQEFFWPKSLANNYETPLLVIRDTVETTAMTSCDCLLGVLICLIRNWSFKKSFFVRWKSCKSCSRWQWPKRSSVAPSFMAY